MLSVTVILLSKIQNHPTNQFVGNLDKLYIAELLYFLNRVANYPSFGGGGAFPFSPLGQSNKATLVRGFWISAAQSVSWQKQPRKIAYHLTRLILLERKPL